MLFIVVKNISNIDGFQDILVEYLKKYARSSVNERYGIYENLNDKLLITREYGKSGDNLHYHIILDRDMDTKMFRNHFVYKFKESSRPKGLSVKDVHDLKGAIRYIMKDEDVIYNTFNEKLLDEAREANLSYVKRHSKNVLNKNPLYVTIIKDYVPIVGEEDCMEILKHISKHCEEYYCKNVKLFNFELIQKNILMLLLMHYPKYYNRWRNSQLERSSIYMSWMTSIKN